MRPRSILGLYSHVLIHWWYQYVFFIPERGNKEVACTSFTLSVLIGCWSIGDISPPYKVISVVVVIRCGAGRLLVPEFSDYMLWLHSAV